ncbi:hypothetical protein EGW08_004657 [Elysia chlorotica]|uniref:Uncharacterized protein n=1 Tax=Elysia chlorotica TaxID=188477 RepID=A0A3S1HWM3_ELYCH|nr:hypothetical protein EGW08_004657 [Elysia chlorotica]
MAAKKMNETEEGNDTSADQATTRKTGGFEDFIAAQLQQQEKESKQTDNVDTAKRDNFIARATAESERMNREIEKSKMKRDKLEAEFGEEIITQWRNEHAAEVLTPHQAALVEQSYHQQG